MSSSQGIPHSAAGGNDPSMDDILASIRRILSEDETSAPGGPASLPETAPGSPPASGVLTLDATMLVSDVPQASQVAAAVPRSGAIAAPGSEVSEPPPHVAPQQPAKPVVATPPARFAADEAHASDSLVAPEVAAAASASVGTLMRTLVAERQTAIHRGGPTLEDMVREEIRPMLKLWLDTHLPPMVERLVQVEIERVASRAVS